MTVHDIYERLISIYKKAWSDKYVCVQDLVYDEEIIKLIKELHNLLGLNDKWVKKLEY